jgi:type II secretory pathway pseudopilin PulG
MRSITPRRSALGGWRSMASCRPTLLLRSFASVKNGFTLIELLVVIAIIRLMFGSAGGWI